MLGADVQIDLIAKSHTTAVGKISIWSLSGRFHPGAGLPKVVFRTSASIDELSRCICERRFVQTEVIGVFD